MNRTWRILGLLTVPLLFLAVPVWPVLGGTVVDSPQGIMGDGFCYAEGQDAEGECSMLLRRLPGGKYLVLEDSVLRFSRPARSEYRDMICNYDLTIHGGTLTVQATPRILLLVPVLLELMVVVFFVKTKHI